MDNYADAQKDELNSTAENYISFLSMASQLFLVLGIISVTTMVSVWGFDALVMGYIGADASNLYRLVYDSSRLPCVEGPSFDTSAPNTSSWWCSASLNNSLFSHHAAGAFPGGLYLGLMSPQSCFDVGSACQAQFVAYDSSPTEVDSVECWLLAEYHNYSSLSTSPSAEPQYFICEAVVSAWPGRIMFALTLLYGVIVCIFAAKFVAQLQKRSVSEIQRHTIWLTSLPYKDNDDGELFELQDNDFIRVAEDLKRELTKFISKAWHEKYGIPLGTSAEEPIISEVYVVHAGDDAEHLAGHAFAVLSKEVYAKLLLHSDSSCVPAWCHWRDYALFKFGVPPWASITLRCQRAPPPSDISWENLHVPQRWLASFVLQCLLLVFVAIVSAPDLSIFLLPWLSHLHQGGRLSDRQFERLTSLLAQIPSLLLLLMNTFLLPWLISIIAAADRPHLKSGSETAQYQMNLQFLILTTIIVPLLHLVLGNKNLLEQIEEQLQGSWREDFPQNLYAVMNYFGGMAKTLPTELVIKYVLNATWVSNGLQLIQFGIGFVRCCGCQLPSPFAWGYWYAWATAILYLALTLSVVVPSVAPLAALFFFITFLVHRANLRRGVYLIWEMDAFFESRVAGSVFTAVGFFWFAMSCYFFVPVDRNILSAGVVLPFTLPHIHFSKTPSRDSKIRMVVSIILASLALLSALGSLYLVRGPVQSFIFRRFGRGWPDRVVCFLGLLPLPLLIGAVFGLPEFEWEFTHHKLEENYLFCIILDCLACLSWILSRIFICLQRRRSRISIQGKGQDKARYFSHEDFVSDLATLRHESDLTMSRIVLQHDWYRPPDRANTVQRLDTITCKPEVRTLLDTSDEEFGSSGTEDASSSSASH